MTSTKHLLLAGVLIEDTLDWYAQDADGNVWCLGEDTAEFEDGQPTTRESSFEAGVDGEVLAVGQQSDVPMGHFDDVLLTADTITLEPDVLELKLYAPGVGMVAALGISGGSGREELVSTRQVSDEIAQAAGTAPLGEPYA